MRFFNKKLPAWMLLAALVIVGAGAATGLVLKDQITGTTTIAVSQAIRVGAPNGNTGGDGFLGTANDNGVEWAAHFEANNGDTLTFDLPFTNEGDGDIVVGMTLSIPEGLTVSMTSTDVDIDDVTQVGPNDWKFIVRSDADGTADDSELGITIAIEDAQPTGFYELSGTIVPLNV